MAEPVHLSALSLAVSKESAGASHRFARWNAEVFDEWASGPIAELWAQDPARGRDLLALVAEGVGRGWLGALSQRPKTWLDGLLRGPVLSWLPELPASERAPLLATAWNLGEGALREDAWIDRFLLARLSALTGPRTLPQDVILELEPLLDPAPPSPWTGPYRVSTMDLRASDDAFLPGALRFVGPRLLAVADRRRDIVLGLLLGPGQPSVLGALDLEELPAAEPDGLPEVRWEGELVIGAQRIALPRLGEPLELAIAPTGYVVASAVHSQRLWVVAHA